MLSAMYLTPGTTLPGKCCFPQKMPTQTGYDACLRLHSLEVVEQSSNPRICLSDTLNLVFFAVRRGKWSDLPTGVKVPGHVASVERKQDGGGCPSLFPYAMWVLKPFSSCRV